MNEQGAKEAGRVLVVEAADLVLPPSFKSNFCRLEDPVTFKRLAVDVFFCPGSPLLVTDFNQTINIFGDYLYYGSGVAGDCFVWN